METRSKSLEETREIARIFLNNLPKTEERALLVGLVGNLGSGKTTFTQQVAEILGVGEQITSPTFVIEKIYELPEAFSGFKKLIHIDAYRLDKGEELLKIGFEDIVKDKENLILMEWPERVEDALSPNYPKINFEFIDEETRSIEILWLKPNEN